MSIQTVENILKEKITKNENFVLKYVDIGQGSGKLNDGVLQAEKSAEYLQALTTSTKFLDSIKMVASHNHKREVDMMSFDVELEAGRYNEQGQEIIRWAANNNVKLIKELEEGISVDMLRDPIHPNEKGQRFEADLMKKYIKLN